MPARSRAASSPTGHPGVEGPRVEPVDVIVGGVRADVGGATVLDGVDLDVAPGGVLSLLGPSGCGKTTLLRVIAGLEPVTAGEVRVDGEVLSSEHAVVAPERRRVGMVFQDWALFPHLSVAQNVGFGLARGERRTSPRISATLDLVGLAGLGDRMPDALSGGQQQRVALARALAQQPAVLLLDEPFSNLDASLRARVRADARQLLQDIGITTMLVTHDRDEAFVLGDRVAVMRAGRIVQAGRPEDLYRFPADAWAARLLGEVTLLEGRAGGRSAVTPLGTVTLADAVHGRVQVALRPEQLRLSGRAGSHGTRSGGRAGQHPGAPATVRQVSYVGPRTTYELELTGSPGGVRVRVEEQGPPRLVAGDTAAVVAPDEPVAAFPAPD